MASSWIVQSTKNLSYASVNRYVRIFDCFFEVAPWARSWRVLMGMPYLELAFLRERPVWRMSARASEINCSRDSDIAFWCVLLRN